MAHARPGASRSGLLLLGACALLCCAGAPLASGSSDGCPTGAQQDPPRLGQVKALLQHDGPSLALVQRSKVVVCFVPGLGRGVVSKAALLLDPLLSDGELAATWAHLLTHEADGLGDGCAAGSAAASASEARALAVEARLRQQLALPPPSLAAAAERDYEQRCRRP